MSGERIQSRLFGILPGAVLLVLANATLAQGLARPRYPISEADIAKELGVVGLSVNASQVHLPAHMSAATSSPKLEIATAQPTGDSQVRIELRCSKPGECLPFFATVDVKDAKVVTTEIQSKTISATAATHQTEMRIGEKSLNRPQLRAGSHAVLMILDGYLDIHLQVLAIDSGLVGQQVRVCTLDRKKVFHATVTGEETVTGEIE